MHMRLIPCCFIAVALMLPANGFASTTIETIDDDFNFFTPTDSDVAPVRGCRRIATFAPSTDATVINIDAEDESTGVIQANAQPSPEQQQVRFTCEDFGYAIVLPGIDGNSLLNFRVKEGLRAGGFRGQIEVIDWTTGNAALFLYHLATTDRKQRQAMIVRNKIIHYMNCYPGRPVHVIGHSAGTAVAALAIESLPNGYWLNSVVFLSSALSPKYDLTNVLRHCRYGVWNFRSKFDAVLLGAGTLLFGTADRKHTFSAGAIGFKCPRHATSWQKQLYRNRLHDRPYKLTMATRGHFGSHWATVQKKFVTDNVAPVLRSTAGY